MHTLLLSDKLSTTMPVVSGISSTDRTSLSLSLHSDKTSGQVTPTNNCSSQGEEDYLFKQLAEKQQQTDNIRRSQEIKEKEINQLKLKLANGQAQNYRRGLFETESQEEIRELDKGYRTEKEEGDIIDQLLAVQEEKTNIFIRLDELEQKRVEILKGTAKQQEANNNKRIKLAEKEKINRQSEQKFMYHNKMHDGLQNLVIQSTTAGNTRPNATGKNWQSQMNPLSTAQS